jgi:hypothetical protein
VNEKQKVEEAERIPKRHIYAVNAAASVQQIWSEDQRRENGAGM